MFSIIKTPHPHPHPHPPPSPKKTMITEILAKIPWNMATSIETQFDAQSSVQFANHHYHIPITAVAIYATFITIGPRILNRYYKHDNQSLLTKPRHT
jgi:hypothetical protein